MLFYVRDRKKIVAKKSVNTIQKENMVMNGRGNAAHPVPNLEQREKIQNGAHPLSVALSEAPSDKISMPNANGTLAFDNLGLKRDPEHSSLVSSRKGPLKESSVGHKGESRSTVDGSGDSVNLGHAAKNITHNKSFGIVEEQNTSALKLANTEMQQYSFHMNKSSDSVMIPSGAKDNGKESSIESAKKAPISLNSEMVFCSFLSYDLFFSHPRSICISILFLSSDIR